MLKCPGFTLRGASTLSPMNSTRRALAAFLLVSLLGCARTTPISSLPVTTSMPRQTVGWAEKLTHENFAILTALPSGVPVLTLPHGNNAGLAALNILAQRNPAVYAYRCAAIEDLMTS